MVAIKKSNVKRTDLIKFIIDTVAKLIKSFNRNPKKAGKTKNTGYILLSFDLMQFEK